MMQYPELKMDMWILVLIYLLGRCLTIYTWMAPFYNIFSQQLLASPHSFDRCTILVHSQMTGGTPVGGLN